MPVGGDGLDLLEHVKNDVVWRSIPVVSMPSSCHTCYSSLSSRRPVTLVA